MNRLDWVAVAVVGFAALAGLRKGLVGSAFSAGGIAVGAVIGARVVPRLIGEAESPYTPLAALAGALIGAVVLETVGSIAGHSFRRSLRLTPFRTLDSAGGLAVGIAVGFALVWVLGAAALYVPGQRDLRREAQRSLVLRRLNAVAPPARLLAAIQRVDPFPAILGPLPPATLPDPAVARTPAVVRAAPSVVRVVGTACGLGVSGTGWVARPGLVVTAAHVVAGQHDTEVVLPSGSSERVRARVVAFDARNDIAVLRVRGLRARPLALGDASPEEPVAILGYPESGPFTVRAGRIGRTVGVFTEDAYGRPARREVTSLRGDVRQGDSGAPVVGRGGAVEAVVFAARAGGHGGYAVPPGIVRRDLALARRPVSTGPCAR